MMLIDGKTENWPARTLVLRNAISTPASAASAEASMNEYTLAA